MHRKNGAAQPPDDNARVRTERPIGTASSCNPHTISATEHGTSVGPQRKRLARARVEAAEVLDELLDENWRSGRPDADVFSNRALAERLLDVDEKTVRQWRDADKPMPIAALLCLPLPFGEDLTERLLSARRLLAGDRRAVVALGRAVARVDAYATHGVLTNGDRAALTQSVRRFIDELVAVVDGLENQK